MIGLVRMGGDSVGRLRDNACRKGLATHVPESELTEYHVVSITIPGITETNRFLSPLPQPAMPVQ